MTKVGAQVHSKKKMGALCRAAHFTAVEREQMGPAAGAAWKRAHKCGSGATTMNKYIMERERKR